MATATKTKSEINTKQVQGLRDIAAGKEIDGRTMRALKSRDLVTKTGKALTAKGKKLV